MLYDGKAKVVYGRVRYDFVARGNVGEDIC
jgi:hypothetical protein